MTTGTLALIGGGEWTDGCDFDAGLLAASGSMTVLVVPTAAAFERPDHHVARARDHFAALGATVEVLDVMRRRDAMSTELAERASTASFIYLSSGSPMHLRSVVLGTPVWDAIVSGWRAGAVLAASGESASALSTHMVDPRGGAFTVGLDLLDRLTVIPRWSTWSEDKWHRTVRLARPGMAVVGIDERTALVFDDRGWTVSGAGSVSVHLDGRRVDLGDLPPLDLT